MVTFREGSKSGEVAALLQKNIETTEVVRRTGAKPSLVYWVRKRLNDAEKPKTRGPDKKSRRKPRQKRQPYDTRVAPLMLECIISRGGEKLAHVMTGETDFAEVLAVALLRAKGTP